MALNGHVRMTKDISLGTILHAVVIIITAAGFWFGLSGRLDGLQIKLEAQAEDISEVKAKIDKIEDRLFDQPRTVR